MEQTTQEVENFDGTRKFMYLREAQLQNNFEAENSAANKQDMMKICKYFKIAIQPSQNFANSLFLLRFSFLCYYLLQQIVSEHSVEWYG